MNEEFARKVELLINTVENAETEKLSELASIAGLDLTKDFVGVDLSGEDLRNDSLSSANLSDANLSGANLSSANLSGANLSGANLSDANLNGANLNGANLSGADLNGANLSNTDLDSDSKMFSDRQLHELAIEAQGYPALSSQRQVLINRLANYILQSPSLGHPQINSWNSSQYQDFYDDALQETLLIICRTIENYDPTRPIMAWVNFHLKNQFSSVVKRYYRQGITHIPRSQQAITCFPSLDELEKDIAVEETISNAQLLRQFLQDDPEDRLKNEHIRGRPDITFQVLAIAKFIEDRTWTEIAQDSNISIKTLSSFFSRKLEQLMPYFNQYLPE